MFNLFTSSSTNNSLMDFIFGLILIPFGILYLLIPRFMWNIDHFFQKWINPNVKPSDAYFKYIKVVAVACIILGVYLIINYMY